MGLRRLSKDLRQAGQTSASDQPVQQRVAEARRRATEELRHVLPQWHFPASSESGEATEGSMRAEVFLSLLGGVGE